MAYQLMQSIPAEQLPFLPHWTRPPSHLHHSSGQAGEQPDVIQDLNGTFFHFGSRGARLAQAGWKSRRPRDTSRWRYGKKEQTKISEEFWTCHTLVLFHKSVWFSLSDKKQTTYRVLLNRGAVSKQFFIHQWLSDFI